MTQNPSLLDWSNHLRSISEPIGSPKLPSEVNLIQDFRDEFGHRRAVDEPLIRHLCHFGKMGNFNKLNRRREPDVELWWMTHEDLPDAWQIIERGDNALTHRSDDAQIEIWTETELSSLHAAWTIATRLEDEELADRCLAAATWHTRELQPDNGTNHPWAIHVFLELWTRNGLEEARIHAETMLHNCTVQQGQPDVFSALILMHAARELASSLN